MPDTTAKNGLAALDQATVRALTEAGELTTRQYLDIARAHGWPADDFARARAARLLPPLPQRDYGDET